MDKFDDAAFDKYIDELPDLLTGLGLRKEDGVLPDGSFCDWDAELGVAVETAAGGRRFIVELQDGKVIRIRELVNVAA